MRAEVRIINFADLASEFEFSGPIKVMKGACPERERKLVFEESILSFSFFEEKFVFLWPLNEIIYLSP